MIGEAGFRKAVLLERGVGWVVMDSIAPIAERVDWGPTMWVRWGLCEERKIRGVLVHHRDDVDQAGAIGPCLLSVDGEELELFDRRGGVWSLANSCVPVRPRLSREIGKVRGRGDPIWTSLG